VGDAESGVDAASRLRSFFVERSVSENFALLGTWAVGLRLNPWATIDPWVDGFNEARFREILPGSLLTPDEMMMEWTGKSGFGGLPHLSYIKRKPKPLGTELKSVCEGTIGMCIFIEIQKGKIAMARKKWASDYGATTACTVRLIDQLHISELAELTPPRR
jgi:hypothetical protein